MEVVLVPSAADAHLEPVFPQWPFSRGALPEMDEDEQEGAYLNFLRRVTLLPNPATFVCGDLVWGACSADAPFHLNPEVAARFSGGKPPDRFALTAAQLLAQRSFYPLYPAASSEAGGGAGVPLEVSRLRALGMPCSPDVLLLPSRLGLPCARPVGTGTVAVNPGALARHRAYAKVAVFPLPEALIDGVEAAGGAYVENNAPSRVCVEIEKLVRAQEE
jgi:DNA polymerase alpha subunit B